MKRGGEDDAPAAPQAGAAAGDGGSKVKDERELQKRMRGSGEDAWLLLGSVSQLMEDDKHALQAYHTVLKHNPFNLTALKQIGLMHLKQGAYSRAVEFFRRVLNQNKRAGEVWEKLGFAYLMLNNLQRAYTSYQQALCHAPNPKNPNLWYGIGMLYDRYGSLPHAEEAFRAVLKMDPKFTKATDVHFRLAVVLSQRGKGDEALDHFQVVLDTPDSPLAEADVWLQIGAAYERMEAPDLAEEAYSEVLQRRKDEGIATQQLAWLRITASEGKNESAMSTLTAAVTHDPTQFRGWLLLGMAHLRKQQLKSAFEYLQMACQLNGKNATVWCAMGAVYFQMKQHQDALFSYTRAMNSDAKMAVLWVNIGILYDTRAQRKDAIVAYRRALRLMKTPSDAIQTRVAWLETEAASAAAAAVAAAAASRGGEEESKASEPAGKQPPPPIPSILLPLVPAPQLVVTLAGRTELAKQQPAMALPGTISAAPLPSASAVLPTAVPRAAAGGGLPVDRSRKHIGVKRSFEGEDSVRADKRSRLAAEALLSMDRR